jgi:hypothetical protein
MSKFTRNCKPKSKSFAHYTAAEAIGDLSHNCEIFAFNKGQFYLIDIIEHILQQIGKSDIDILTWAIGSKTIDSLVYLQGSGKINKTRIIIDYSYATMHPKYCSKLRQVFGDDAIRVTKNHAKITLIRNTDWNLSIRSSMNLNVNRRLEYLEISDDIEMMAYFVDFFDEWFKTESTGLSFDYDTRHHTDELDRFGNDGIETDLGFNGIDGFKDIGDFKW